MYFFETSVIKTASKPLLFYFKENAEAPNATRKREYSSYSKTEKFDEEPGGQNSKRARTIFTAEQLEQMEREFQKQQYVVGHERMYLANALHLTEAQVCHCKTK